jgi:adenylate kinase family enzyme
MKKPIKKSTLKSTDNHIKKLKSNTKDRFNIKNKDILVNEDVLISNNEQECKINFADDFNDKNYKNFFETERIKDNETYNFLNWDEKYRPKSLNDYINYQRYQPYIELFIKPLLKQNKSSKPFLIITGNTGVGKTTLAQCIFNDYNYNYIELNTSQACNKANIHEILDGSGKTIKYDNNGKNMKNGLLVDELDKIYKIDNDIVNTLLEYVLLDKVNKNIKNYKDINYCIRYPVIITLNNIKKKKFKLLTDLGIVINIDNPNNNDMTKLIKNIINKENINQYINFFNKSNINILVNNSRLDYRHIIQNLYTSYLTIKSLLYSYNIINNNKETNYKNKINKQNLSNKKLLNKIKNKFNIKFEKILFTSKLYNQLYKLHNLPINNIISNLITTTYEYEKNELKINCFKDLYNTIININTYVNTYVNTDVNKEQHKYYDENYVNNKNHNNLKILVDKIKIFNENNILLKEEFQNQSLSLIENDVNLYNLDFFENYLFIINSIFNNVKNKYTTKYYSNLLEHLLSINNNFLINYNINFINSYVLDDCNKRKENNINNVLKYSFFNIAKNINLNFLYSEPFNNYINKTKNWELFNYVTYISLYYNTNILNKLNSTFDIKTILKKNRLNTIITDFKSNFLKNNTTTNNNHLKKTNNNHLKKTNNNHLKKINYNYLCSDINNNYLLTLKKENDDIFKINDKSLKEYDKYINNIINNNFNKYEKLFDINYHIDYNSMKQDIGYINNNLFFIRTDIIKSNDFNNYDKNSNRITNKISDSKNNEKRETINKEKNLKSESEMTNAEKIELMKSFFKKTKVRSNNTSNTLSNNKQLTYNLNTNLLLNDIDNYLLGTSSFSFCNNDYGVNKSIITVNKKFNKLLDM